MLRINKSLEAQDAGRKTVMGLLDIYGFEIMTTNRCDDVAIVMTMMILVMTLVMMMMMMMMMMMTIMMIKVLLLSLLWLFLAVFVVLLTSCD